MLKKFGLKNALFFGAMFAIVLYALPRKVNFTYADSYNPACSVVETSSIYYVQNCQGYYRNGMPYHNNNNYNSYPQNNYSNGSSLDQRAWFAACDVVERNSAYYQQNCANNPVVNNNRGGYNYGQNSYYTPVYNNNNNYYNNQPSSYVDANGYVCSPQRRGW